MRKRISRLMTVAGLAGLASVGLMPAHADTKQADVVSEKPASWTPDVKDGTVRDYAIVGDTVVAGGSFTKVAKAGGAKVIKRTGLVAFDRTTGKIDPDFAPTLDGSVNALAAGPDGTVYVGGTFKRVNGSAERGVTQLRLSNGTRVGAFMKASTGNGVVHTLVRSGGKIYIGGSFSKVNDTTRVGLARLDATSGAVDPALNLPIADQRSGALKVQQLAVGPKGTRLVIDGTFTKVAGEARNQIAMINTPNGGKASLADWSTKGYSDTCNIDAFDTYLRDIDFSPGGDYFVVVSTGGPYGDDTLCDAATRWETSPDSADAKPTWTNWTGGDSLYSVSVTGSAVYVGGHQRWLDNPKGHDDAGEGAVSRPGIGAINPSTGKALSWNPTKDRGHGVEALVAGPGGLWVGSDTTTLAHEQHARVGMFPLPGQHGGGGTPGGGHSPTPTPTPTSSGHSGGSSGSSGHGSHGSSGHGSHQPGHGTNGDAGTEAGQHGNGQQPAQRPAAGGGGNAPAGQGIQNAAKNLGGKDLPFTGSPIALTALIAGLLLVGGGGTMLVARRMRRAKS